MIMVHAITKHGPLVSCDSNSVPIQEGWFKPKSKGKGREGSSDFKMKDEDTAEFLWQAKLSKGDYHASMTDVMFMEWLERRLAPAFKKLFGHEKMILVLDNASYHHGFDEEVGVPETNSKKYNVKLLRKFGAKSITVKRKQTAPNVGVAEFHFEVPQEAGSTFPGVRSVGGVSKEEVAIATRE